jgi:hypothetical protein
MANWVGGRTQEWEALAPGVASRALEAFAWTPRGTRLGTEAGRGVGGIFSSTAENSLQKTYKTSGWTAVSWLRRHSIRKKVIGHGMRSVAPGFGVGGQLRRARSSFALLQEQTRQHRGGVFVKPLIQQGADFLADIGGVRQAREFKALQGVPRGRKQEFPGWLGRAGSHRPSDREHREH